MVTLLFTDVEDSTRLLHELGDLPVDLRIPGFPPTPRAIAQALLGLIDATASPAG